MAASMQVNFSQWKQDFIHALENKEGLDVPCGDCRACCTSGMFIHVGPEEQDALAHIPDALLFDAPGAPPGHRLMGYSEQGHCPMFKDNRCTIYAHRPLTCRQFDCRLFAAIELYPPAPEQQAIAHHAQTWTFTAEQGDTHLQLAALRQLMHAMHPVGGSSENNATQVELPPNFPTSPAEQARLILKALAKPGPAQLQIENIAMSLKHMLK